MQDPPNSGRRGCKPSHWLLRNPISPTSQSTIYASGNAGITPSSCSPAGTETRTTRRSRNRALCATRSLVRRRKRARLWTALAARIRKRSGPCKEIRSKPAHPFQEYIMSRRLALVPVLFAFCILLASVSTAEEKRQPDKKAGGGMEGVKGTLYMIDGKKSKDSKLTVQPHDVIVIEWTYPIAPPFPKSASQNSSDKDIVKTMAVHRVVNVKGPIGVGRL